MCAKQLQQFERQLFDWENSLIDMENDIQKIEARLMLENANYIIAERNLDQMEKVLSAIEEVVQKCESNSHNQSSKYFGILDEIKNNSRRIETIQDDIDEYERKLNDDQSLTIHEVLSLVTYSYARFEYLHSKKDELK